MAALILGPLLRHVGTTTATVWVETDQPCTVEVLGTPTRTFGVEGHHYALVIIEGLAPASVTPYEVHLDGARCWPPDDSALPPSIIRTHDDGTPVRLLFASCRVAAPHEPPWTLELAHDPKGRGVDALRAHGLRMLHQPIEAWPDLVVLLGDQVYADDSSPVTREKVKRKRGSNPDIPRDCVADFEEYTWLYHESWQQDVERWVLSVVPSAMIFDDHDMIDDWNISASWVRDIRTQPWWEAHVTGGLMSYWIYQHLGNLAPEQIRAEAMLEAMIEAEDAGPYLRAWAERSEAATPVPGGYRFTYQRELGGIRLVVIDSRNGRVLEPGARSMVDDDEWAWVVERSLAPCEHLVLATSLPVLLPGGIHDLQVWNERVCDGAWGGWAARFGERVRRSLDLEDWAAFGRSFDAFADLLTAAATPSADRPSPPATVAVISGDIHFSYVATAELPAPAVSRVHQLVSSPIRNALVPRERRVIRASLSRMGRAVGKLLRHGVRGRRPGLRWSLRHGPVFANVMSMVSYDGTRANLIIEQARPDDDGAPTLSTVVETAL